MTDRPTDDVVEAAKECADAANDMIVALNEQILTPERYNEAGERIERAVAKIDAALSIVTTQPSQVDRNGLAGELAELLTDASEGPWAYCPDEYDDWGVIRGPEKTVDWAEYPVRPHVAKARHSAIQDEAYLAQCRANKTDPWAGDAKLIVWLRNHVPEILTALRSDSEAVALLREAREQLNDTSLLTGNLEWRRDLGTLVDRIDQHLERLDR